MKNTTTRLAIRKIAKDQMSGIGKGLTAGSIGLGTYALTRLLGGNKWLSAALGLGSGLGSGYLLFRNNDESQSDATPSTESDKRTTVPIIPTVGSGDSKATINKKPSTGEADKQAGSDKPPQSGKPVKVSEAELDAYMAVLDARMRDEAEGFYHAIYGASKHYEGPNRYAVKLYLEKHPDELAKLRTYMHDSRSKDFIDPYGFRTSRRLRRKLDEREEKETSNSLRAKLLRAKLEYLFSGRL